jgi:hypothetical protein
MTGGTGWERTVGAMRARGIELAEGLSDREVATVEARYGFRFPADLRAFLQTALPRGGRFPDWRGGDDQTLRSMLALPREGIAFDVTHNGFWLDEWGPRPATDGEALRILDQELDAAPRLIPVYGHRMMPDDPSDAGSPVFSVHQTDIIHYGLDLASYFSNDFGVPAFTTPPEKARAIRFWDVVRSETR